ncbi:MAG: hypothetical protein ACR2KK_17065, partial [Acidimicrobiales bacterium]
MAEAAGISRNTLIAGAAELVSGVGPSERIRPSAGRKKATGIGTASAARRSPSRSLPHGQSDLAIGEGWTGRSSSTPTASTSVVTGRPGRCAAWLKSASNNPRTSLARRPPSTMARVMARSRRVPRSA